MGGQKIARSIKDMIGKSNKFAETPSAKRRRYYVEYIECVELPIRAKIMFEKK